MNATFSRWLEALLHIHDTPERTAFAFALGVFFGFSPLLGLHTVLGLLCAFLLRLNRVSVLLGVYSNTPWFIAPYYALTTWTGAVLLGANTSDGLDDCLGSLFNHSVFTTAFWDILLEFLRPWFWPFMVGSTLGALVLALVAYRLALAVIVARRRTMNRPHQVSSQ